MRRGALRIASASDAIGDRERQEDYSCIVLKTGADGERRALCVLADGMGGHVGGQIASRLAVENFVQSVRENQGQKTKERLQEALRAANEAIARRIAEQPNLSGMGCTLVGAWKKSGRLSWISVGDSPMWLFRKGKLERLNADHSVGGELAEQVARGEATPAEVDAHPQRHALRSAVMGQSIPLIDIRQISVTRGDRIVIASDGIETLTVREIEQLLRRHKRAAPAEMAEILVDEVMSRGKSHQDNTTVIVLDEGTAPLAGTGHAALLATVGLASIVAGIIVGYTANYVTRSPATAETSNVPENDKETSRSRPDSSAAEPLRNTEPASGARKADDDAATRQSSSASGDQDQNAPPAAKPDPVNDVGRPEPATETLNVPSPPERDPASGSDKPKSQ